MVEVRPVLEKVVTDVYTALSPRTMVVADLGCSSGPNTLHFVSDVIRVTGDCCSRACRDPPELQFFLNDMPGNDFNSLFRSLDAQRKNTAASMPPHYVVGLPGSFYTRLFPERSVHFFHSSYCLMWLSQLPKELQVNSKIHLNEGNIYLRTTTSPSVVQMYQEQFQKDFLLFIKLRAKELGIVEKARLDSFNLPIYGPSVDEVVAAVKQSEVYDINHIQLFESNWDPYDDSEGDFVVDTVQSGINVAKCLRAVMEPLLVRHFGEYILDELFERDAFNVAKHLEREKTRYSVIVVSLRSRP
nr:unnamed protein product [Digitaria exilis]